MRTDTQEIASFYASQCVATPIITSAKLNDVESFACLKDVLERMSTGHPMSRLDDLLPLNWQPQAALN